VKFAREMGINGLVFREAGDLWRLLKVNNL